MEPDSASPQGWLPAEGQAVGRRHSAPARGTAVCTNMLASALFPQQQPGVSSSISIVASWLDCQLCVDQSAHTIQVEQQFYHNCLVTCQSMHHSACQCLRIEDNTCSDATVKICVQPVT